MPSWGWVLAALLLFGALQLLALRYAMRREESGVTSRGVGPYAVEPARIEEGHVEDAGTTDGGLRCPRCGAENRSGFTYCRNCVAFLTG